MLPERSIRWPYGGTDYTHHHTARRTGASGRKDSESAVGGEEHCPAGDELAVGAAGLDCADHYLVAVPC